MISEWAKRFKEGRTSVDDDKRAGAPRTAVTRDNIAAVDLAIKQNRRISVLELSSNIGVSVGSIDTIIHEHLLYSKVTARWVPKMLTEQHKQARGLLSKGVMLQHDNARAHTANVTSSTITKLGWEVLVHPPYSPDLAPSDYHLFGPLKDHLGGMKFDTDDDVKIAVQNWLHIMPETFFSAGIRALPTRWKKCIEVQGDYVEK